MPDNLLVLENWKVALVFEPLNRHTWTQKKKLLVLILELFSMNLHQVYEKKLLFQFKKTPFQLSFLILVMDHSGRWWKIMNMTPMFVSSSLRHEIRLAQSWKNFDFHSLCWTFVSPKPFKAILVAVHDFRTKLFDTRLLVRSLLWIN